MSGWARAGGREIPTGDRDDLADEAAALAAAGAASPDEAALAGGDVPYAGVVAELAAAIPPAEPPAGAKARLLGRLPPRDDPRAGDRSAAAALAGVGFRFAEDGVFGPTRHPGVWARVLHVDRARRQFTALVRLDPGARYPSHPHDGPEECLVLSGEVRVGGVRMRAGDYQRAEAGSDHPEQWSETGAVLYVTGPVGLLGA